MQDKTIHLAAVSKDEEKSWFKDLCKAVFGNANRNSIVQVIINCAYWLVTLTLCELMSNLCYAAYIIQFLLC